jgi:hypothetical protein
MVSVPISSKSWMLTVWHYQISGFCTQWAAIGNKFGVENCIDFCYVSFVKDANDAQW